MGSDLTDSERSTKYIVDPQNYNMEEYCKQVQGNTWIYTMVSYEQVYYVNNDKFIDADLMDIIVRKAKIECGLNNFRYSIYVAENSNIGNTVFALPYDPNS